MSLNQRSNWQAASVWPMSLPLFTFCRLICHIPTFVLLLPYLVLLLSYLCPTLSQSYSVQLFCANFGATLFLKLFVSVPGFPLPLPEWHRLWPTGQITTSIIYAFTIYCFSFYWTVFIINFDCEPYPPKSVTIKHVSAPGLHELVRSGLPRSACGKNPPWSGPLGKGYNPTIPIFYWVGSSNCHKCSLYVCVTATYLPNTC